MFPVITVVIIFACFLLNSVTEYDLIYRILINKFPATLKLNRWNRIKMKIIHKKYWIQKEKSNFLKRAIVTTIISSMLSILTYAISQKIGYSKGYQDGLKQGIQPAPKSIQPLELLPAK